MPAAITGPAATPFKTTTPMIVPKTSATVTSGLCAIKLTPRAESTATKIPQMIAIQPIGERKALTKSLSPIRPVAIGTRIVIEIKVTPQLIPLAESNSKNFSICGRKCQSNFKAMITPDAINRLSFFPKAAIKRITAKKIQLSKSFIS